MYLQRLLRVQKKIKELNLNGIFITHPLNINYLTGFSGVSITERETVLLVKQNEILYYVPLLYKKEGEVISQNIPNIHLVFTEERHYLLIEAAKLMNKGEKIGFESTNLRFNEYSLLKEYSNAEFIPTTSIIEDIRITKDQQEIANAQKAVDITDNTYDYLIKNVKKGMTEVFVGKMIKNKMEELGAEGMSFDPVVAFGADSALPHYRPTNKIIGEDDGILLIDMGAKYKGYMGDLTRVMYFGTPDQKYIDTYNLVLKSEEEAISKIKSGITCEEAWAIADNSLGDQSEFFIHGLGHGVGLDIHEDPYLRKGINIRIPDNCFVTIEPGLYYPNWGGVRIEDYCLITNEGVHVMSKATKEIIIL